jgi:hypothetical protein
MQTHPWCTSKMRINYWKFRIIFIILGNVILKIIFPFFLLDYRHYYRQREREKDTEKKFTYSKNRFKWMCAGGLLLELKKKRTKSRLRKLFRMMMKLWKGYLYLILEIIWNHFCLRTMDIAIFTMALDDIWCVIYIVYIINVSTLVLNIIIQWYCSEEEAYYGYV